MKVLIIPGSVRPNSAGNEIANTVTTLLQTNYDSAVEMVDFRELELPFYDASTPPASDQFSTDHAAVARWSSMVKAADGLVFLVPEYNHSMTAVQKNAIDWLYHEWHNKPAAVVAYGAYAGANSLETFHKVSANVKLDVVEPIVQLKLGQDLGWDGSAVDAAEVSHSLETALAALASRLVAAS